MKILILLILGVAGNLLAQDDIFFHRQWNLASEGQTLQRDLDDLHSEEVIADGSANWGYKWWKDHGIKKVKKNIIVAVLDSGIDSLHPDLILNTLSSGRNFAVDKDDFSSDVFDYTGHGTHVSGVIAATQNDIGVSGLGNFIKILPIKIFHKNEKKYKKKPLSKRIAQGIRYAIEQNASIINLSLGWPKVMHTKNLRLALEEALAKGILIVSASGNSSNVSSIYPCALKDVICVGSVDPNNKLSSFSNYGQNVDVLAPGEMILSTYPKSRAPLKFSVQGYEILSGTSQAAPLISGMLAQLLATFPNETTKEIKNKLFASSQGSLYSLYGLPNIKLAATKRLKNIYPIIKGTSRVKIDRDYHFSLTVPFEFYNLKEDDLSVISKDINLAQSDFKISLNNKEIVLNGKVKGEVNYGELVIQSSKTNRQFKIYLEFLYSSDSKTRSLSLENKKRLPLLVKNNIRLISRLQLVKSLKSHTPKSLFYFNDKEDNELKIFKEKNHEIVKTNSLKIVEGCRLLKFNHIKIRNVEQDSYLLESYCSNDKKEQFLLYQFFNEHFIQIGSPIKYSPEVSLINYKNVSFELKKNHVEITFASVGTLPEKSLNPDPWADQDLGKKMRLYHLRFDNGSYITYQLNNYQFSEDNSLDEYKILDIKFSNNIEMVILTGHEWETRSLKLNLTYEGDLMAKEELYLTGLVAQSSFYNITEKLFVLEKFFTPFNATFSFYDRENNEHINNINLKTNYRNPILNRLAHFSSSESTGTVIRSFKYLHYFNYKNEGVTETKIPYARLDFMGVEDLKEKVFILNTDKKNVLGTIIVDGTEISLDSIKVIHFMKDGSVNKKHYEIPSNCASVGASKEDRVELNFLCVVDKKVVLNKFEI